MSAGPVVDRVYARLRERLLTHHYRPGERLEIAELCGELASSNTPVRDALNRLVGEGLVETPFGGGFNVPAVDEPKLADLYRWSGDLLRLAIAGRRRASPAPGTYETADIGYAARVAALFEALAAENDNVEIVRAVERCSVRLSPARTLEPELFPDVDEELAHLVEMSHGPTSSALRSALKRYHARRIQRASMLVRLLHRARS